MDYVKVLKRAWEITWHYRALWIFGIILALTTGRNVGGGGGDGGRGIQYNLDQGDLPRNLPEIIPQVVPILIGIGAGLACVILILIVASAVARYVAETALIRMVDDHEETGQKRTVRQGFRMGWSRTALRLFLLDLLIVLPTVLAVILVFLIALSPLLLWTTDNTVAGVIGTVAGIGLLFLAILLTIVVVVVLSLLMHFFRRTCALEELGVIEAIRQGYTLVRQHPKDVGIMWLIMAGLSLGWIIVMIPVVIMLMLAAGMLGGLPALLIGGLASLVSEGAMPWILGAAVGAPIFILVMAAPLLFLGGLVETFKSSVWTLTYRELRALESLEHAV